MDPPDWVFQRVSHMPWGEMVNRTKAHWTGNLAIQMAKYLKESTMIMRVIVKYLCLGKSEQEHPFKFNS